MNSLAKSLLLLLISKSQINFVFGEECVDEICTLTQPIYFSTPNFPGPYVNAGSKLLLSIKVDSGQNLAFAFQFYRFALGQKDCLYFCSTSSLSDCMNYATSSNHSLTKCANEFDHFRPMHYYDLNDSVYVFFVPQNSTIPYPGAEGRVFPIDKTNQIYNDCTKESLIDLDDNSQVGYYILASDHFYTSTASYAYGTLNISCQQRFTTKLWQNVKVAVYAFSSDATQPMNFTGIQVNDASVSTMSLTGQPYPLAYYFKGEFTISYAFTADKNYYYYLIILPYNDTSSFTECKNIGQNDMSQSNLIDFAALSNTSYGYLANTKCGWNFVNPSENTQLMMLISGYTERCCDVAIITGTIHDPVKYDGYHEWYLIYGTSSGLQMTFESDSTETYTQLSGQVAVIDCTCGANYSLGPGEAQNITLGMNGTYPYCGGIQCTWNVQIDRTSILQISPVLQLIRGDLLTVQNSRQTVLKLQSGTSVYDQTDGVVIFLNSTSKLFTASLDDLRAGFSIFLSAMTLDINTIKKDMCTEDYIDVHGDWLASTYQTVVYEISSKNCQKQLLAYFFSEPQGFLVDVYAGDLATGVPFIWNNFMNATFPLILTGDLVTVRIVRLDGSTSFHALFTTDADVRVYQNTMPCQGSNQAPFSAQVALRENRNRTVILYQPSGSIGGLYGMNFAVNGSLNYELFSGPSTNSQDRLYGEATSCDPKFTASNPPTFIFGQYVTMKLQDNQDGMVLFSCYNQSSVAWVKAFSTGSDVLMAPKYLSPNDAPQKSYIFQLEYDGSGHRSIVLDFLNKIPVNGKLTVIASASDTSSTKEYTSASTTCHQSFDATRLVLNYQWTCDSIDGCGSGLLLQYQLGSTYKTGTASNKSLFLFLALVCVLLLKFF